MNTSTSNKEVQTMLRQIKYFQAVVKNNNFSEAAEECNISQSAISQQIQALERELGFQLLVRKNRTFELTPAGEYFYQKSLILVADYERICHEASKIAHGDKAILRIGYLRSFSGNEFHMALEEFTQKYPDVTVQIEQGNHEELYERLITDKIDIAINDQRRKFSEGYMNLILTTLQSSIEISAHNPLASLPHVSLQELKNTPCILVTSKTQQDTERDYYRDIVGIQGEFIYAENLEAARMLVISGKGFLMTEGNGRMANFGTSIKKVPLYRGEKQITQNFCAFWNLENSGFYIEEFADMLKVRFEK